MRNLRALLAAAFVAFATPAFAQSTGGGSNVGPINGPAGSAAATTFNFGTANTGIYGSSSNTNIASGGNAVGIFTSTGYSIPTNMALTLANKAFIATAPTVTSGLGTSPTVVANGTAGFKITVGASGSPATAEVLAMPTATNGWVCTAYDITTPANTAKQTAFSASSVTMTWSPSAPSLSDVLVHSCTGV